VSCFEPIPFVRTQAGSNQVTVALPMAGIFQFQVVAGDGVNTAARYVWVNVWDRVGAFNPNHQVGRNPDIAPPTSGRQISANPGPF